MHFRPSALLTNFTLNARRAGRCEVAHTRVTETQNVATAADLDAIVRRPMDPSSALQSIFDCDVCDRRKIVRAA
jgi:hypothetical protein